MQRAWIISIGTELALGQSVDTNSSWIAQRLGTFGIRAERHVTVPDELAAIRDVLAQAGMHADMVVVTGGLGPTDDDLTRAALAEAVGEELITDPAGVEQIRAYFARRGREMPERNAVQARRPSGARLLDNACGTAPGIRLNISGTPCYALPGVPFEMRAMFDAQVAPDLRAADAGRVLVSRTLRCFGMGESDIGERLRDLMERGRNPEVGTTAEVGVIGVRLNAWAPTQRIADEMLDVAEREVRSRLGEIVFGRGDEPLAAAVGRLLMERGQTLCTAESCTGGLIGKLMTDVPGSSGYYVGGVVSYANEAKQRLLGVDERLLAVHGAVSEPVAEAMAVGVRGALGSDYALAVTGVAGPGGGSPEKPVGLVYIALATPKAVNARAYQFGSDSPREVIRLRAARTALNRLRLELCVGRE